jgi:hypothetical protein
MGIGGGLKRQGREADHSLPTSAEVKRTWIYTSAPLYRLHGVAFSQLNTGTTLPFLCIIKADVSQIVLLNRGINGRASSRGVL